MKGGPLEPIHRDSLNFVPEGATRLWPFCLVPATASGPPAWKARALLSLGLLQAVAHLQPARLREHWRHLPKEFLARLMHDGGAGREHPSRAFVTQLVRGSDTVLDVGCGAGAGYEALAAAGRETGYVGVDSSAPSIDVARELYPAGDFRVGNASTLVGQFGPGAFDVVIVRHLLEHLPDFERVMDQAITVSRRLAVFVFFLSPRALPLGVRKLDPGLNRPHFYTYIYSRPAIHRFLARTGRHWEWHDGLGVSRTGWLANELNSALVVSRDILTSAAAGTAGHAQGATHV